MTWNSSCDVSVLKGKTLRYIMRTEHHGDDVLTFVVSDDEKYEMRHEQDCCETVSIEEIIGDLGDLVGTPILEAREDTQDDPNAAGDGMWTFYNFRTIKGSVTIRWYGTSNGYYSLRVDFSRVSEYNS